MKKNLSIFSLSLLTIGSVDSIRNLPAAALSGGELFYFFSLAFILFLMPCTFICIWFSLQSEQGIYGWVSKSMGPSWGFLTIWFQWLQNMLIYPTFFAFIAGAFLYVYNPALTTDKVLIFLIINGLIWSLTLINYKGIRLSSQFNVFCSLIGLVIPFVLIIFIGLNHLWTHPQAIGQLPRHSQNSWGCLTAIILSFCGMEITAVHLKKNESHAYIASSLIAMLVIFLTMLFGALTLAFILPGHTLNFISDIPELFHSFFNHIGYRSLSSLFSILLVIGSIGCANNWMLAPIKGLSYATGVSAQRLLLLQALSISLISTLFLFFASISSSYWFMLTLATQIYLFVYLLMFIAAMKLAVRQRITYKNSLILVCLLGISGILIALTVSLTPPPQMQIEGQLFYMIKLGLSLLLFCLPVGYYLNRRRLKLAF